MKTLILKPRVSEKSYGLSQERNTYIFDVPGGANKHQIALAVAAQYGVTVVGVRTANLSGKAKRLFARRGKFVSTQRHNVKKAYITLKQGDNLPVFAAIDEEVKAEAKGSK